MKKLTAKLILLGIVFSAQVASGLYDPSLGRWLNRDPIEEDGGLNLYAMLLSDTVNKTDPWGLEAGIGVSGAAGGMFIQGVEISATFLLTTRLRVCVSLQATHVGVAVGGAAYAGAGGAFSYSSGSLDGSSSTTGGIGGAAGWGPGGSGAADWNSNSLSGAAGHIGPTFGACTQAGRQSVSCTGCAFAMSPFSLQRAFNQANACIAKKLAGQ